MNLRALRDAFERRLRSAEVDEPGPVAEFMLAGILGVGRAEIVARGSDPVPPGLAARVDAAAARLCAGEPMQYVVGWTDFCGRRFRCDRRALIPRPETEELVGLALGEPAAGRPGARLADVGTGTGVLAVTLALSLPQARVTALDLHAPALALAAENAAALGAADRIVFAQADLLARAAPASFDLIAANLPYVETDAMAGLPRHVRDFEPRSALDGGPDGLDLIARLIPQAARALAPGGVLLLETGEAHRAPVGRLLEAAGFEGIVLRRDAAGHDRFARAGRPL